MEKKYDLSHKRKLLYKQNWTNSIFDFHGPVSLSAIALLAVFIGYTIGWPDHSRETFTETLQWINLNLSWFYILSVNLILLAVLYFAFSPYGEIRLGGELARPEFKTFSWMTMLLSCGMGIGLVFYSVAEPMFHGTVLPPFFNPVEPETLPAYMNAMVTTFFHWGMHPWGVYALLSIALAFFAFNRKLPLSIRSIFYPLLKDKIFKWQGHFIDILAILATLLGLATSLGLGAQQIGSGLNFVFPGIESGTGTNITLIIIITGLATISVTTGLKKGIQFLSNLNIYIAAFLMLTILFIAPTRFILNSFVENLGHYFSTLISLSFWTASYNEPTNWQSDWTIFYWGWWVSWSPFVSTFIARISFGRTVREMAVGVLIAPVLTSFLWLSITGNTAIWLQTQEIYNLAASVQNDIATAFFTFLDALFLPAAGLPFNPQISFWLMKCLSIVAIFVITIFFITSSDSGSMVVDLMASGGKLNVPIPQKVFWAFMEGAIAIALLISSSDSNSALNTLQTGVVLTGLPFTALLIITIFSLRKGFYNEMHRLYGEADTLFTSETYEDEEEYYGPENNS